jgi:hypothetical protein
MSREQMASKTAWNLPSLCSAMRCTVSHLSCIQICVPSARRRCIARSSCGSRLSLSTSSTRCCRRRERTKAKLSQSAFPDIAVDRVALRQARQSGTFARPCQWLLSIILVEKPLDDLVPGASAQAEQPRRKKQRGCDLTSWAKPKLTKNGPIRTTKPKCGRVIAAARSVDPIRSPLMR